MTPCVLADYIGKLDANCCWPSVLSTVRPHSFSFLQIINSLISHVPQLKLVRSQYQAAFVAAPDVPWKGENATVRVIGEGAGNFTYVLMEGAGHLVSLLDFCYCSIKWLTCEGR